MKILDTLLEIASDLTAALSAKDRYQRLLHVLNRTIPYDAAALMRRENEFLIPVAARGLSVNAMGRRFASKDHPRLDIICGSKEPVRFSADTDLPDPFDGLLTGEAKMMQRIHSCLGCPLIAENRLIGVLTADAVDPHAFDALDQNFLKAIGSLAGSQMQTTNLIEALELSAERQGLIVMDLMRDMQMFRGNTIIGDSKVIEHLKQEIELVAGSNFTVLVQGETGVGKELVVRAVHAASRRKDGPLLYLNCAALPETLAESELFGHKKGAFTDADRDRPGKFEVADGGTLFLDEIGELPLSIQTKLLRVIQEGEIQRVGSDKNLQVDVRLLAATNRDLKEEVAGKRFRADLFHRLDVYPISVPPLRERREDIDLLVGFFSERTQRKLGLGPVRLTIDTLSLLKQYHWPGNIRELENVVSRSILKASSQTAAGEQIIIHPVHLGSDLGAGISSIETPFDVSKTLQFEGLGLTEAVKLFKKEMIVDALEKNHGNWAATARDLGMHRSNLHNLAKRLNLLE